MPSLDREIDRLYQLPLSEFTKARDELAKREPSHRAAIRGLEKPSLAAWAVNQLYWRQRDRYAALTSAAERLRKTQVAALAGKSADAARAEDEHRVARKAAADDVRALLLDAGEKATSATLTAVGETLEALPTIDRPGRLVRPLKPMGFQGLASLLNGATMAPPRAEVLPFKKPAAARDDASGLALAAKEAARAARQAEREAKRQADARKRDTSNVAAELREAEAGERAANSALARARQALAAAERDRRRLAERLESAATRVDVLDREVRAGERTASRAAIARADLEGQLKRLKGDD